MTPRRATCAEVVTAVIALGPGQRFVGIDGLGAAGKSTLALELAAAVSRVAVVRLDDFQGPGVTEWDWDRFAREVVAPLRAGRLARYAVRAWGEVSATDEVVIEPGGIAVVEGVSSTRHEADAHWDLTVWVDTPEPLRRCRALRRDGPEAEAIWREHWIPSELAYVEREKPWERVDLIVSGDDRGR